MSASNHFSQGSFDLSDCVFTALFNNVFRNRQQSRLYYPPDGLCLCCASLYLSVKCSKCSFGLRPKQLYAVVLGTVGYVKNYFDGLFVYVVFDLTGRMYGAVVEEQHCFLSVNVCSKLAEKFEEGKCVIVVIC